MNSWSRRHLQHRVVLLLFLLTSCPAWADEQALPEPLTLEHALSLLSADHPQLQIAAAELERARAKLWQADAETGLDVSLSSRLRWIDPQATNIDQTRDDHRISLFLNKSLYDFGRSDAREIAAQAEQRRRTLDYRDVFARQRIAIMAAFFDVLLADQAYTRDTEDMSMTYVRFDRARERNALGQLSDIELLEARDLFQASRLRQAQSEAAQRTSRARLADLLNRPGELPAELLLPKQAANARKIPEEVDGWFAALEKNNRQLRALAAQQARARAQLALARADDNPVLLGQIEVSKYTRAFGGNDNWRAGVSLDVPLFNSGRSAALQARRRAELHSIDARLEQQRRTLRQQLLELWTQLNTLQVAKQRLASEQDYRDLYLDRSRARYELEVTADLGDAMVRMTALRYRIMQMEFATALAWAQVDALLDRQQDGLGKPLPDRLDKTTLPDHHHAD